MFEKFDVNDKDIFKVCVMATMSSGKSTFINSIIGEEIMPEKNEACTARTMAVIDNDNSTQKRAHIIRNNGTKEIIEISSQEVLDQINNDEEISEFLIETDIESIANTDKALVLIDTPGVNNSQDLRHGERTEALLKQMDMGVIIYLLNATQLATNDDSILLQMVSEHLKKKEGNVNIIFVLNKIDALDTEIESIAQTVKFAKEYIEDCGIANPVIYPLSANSAKLLKMLFYKKSMTRRQMRSMEEVYDTYCSKDNSMLSYAITDENSEEVYEIGGETVSAQQLKRAIDNTGITAIENRLERYMRDLEQHYNPNIVIKSKFSDSVLQKYNQRLKELPLVPEKFDLTSFHQCNEEIDKSLYLNSEAKNFISRKTKKEIDLTAILDTAVSDKESFIEDIEETKDKAYKIFQSNKYICAKYIEAVFFYPEKTEIEKISSKEFYLISQNGKIWETIDFKSLSKLIDENKEFYIYNESTGYLYKVIENNNRDIMAFMYVKLPIGEKKIPGLGSGNYSIEDVNEYISEIEYREEEKRKDIEEAESKLSRTYKGYLCESEEEKKQLINEEKFISKYCENLGDKSFDELWNEKEKINKLPQSIFSQYNAKLIAEMTLKERREEEKYLEEISDSNLQDLEYVTEEIKNKKYSKEVKEELEEAIERQKLYCEKLILEEMYSKINKNDRKEISKLKSEVKNKKFNDKLTDSYLEKLQKLNDNCEETELREMCSNIELMSIDDIKEIKIQITNESYQDKFTKRYFEILDARKEFLHIKNMEEYCQNVSLLNRAELKNVKDKVEKEDCSFEAKKKFNEIINKRTEQLDYEDLVNITEDLQNKTITQLEELQTELTHGEFNKKFIKQFLLKVRMVLEKGQKNQLMLLTKNLGEMNKEQVIDLEKEIDNLGYFDVISDLAMKQIEERKYVLDMYELMNIENEFNGLSLEDIEDLKMIVKQRNVCHRSIKTYFRKLDERRKVASYQLISKYACCAKEVSEDVGLTEQDLAIATFSDEYEQYFEEVTEKNYSDIPVFFIPNYADIIVTKEEMYCKTNTGTQTFNISNIKQVDVEKKLWVENLKIVLSNGRTFILSGGLLKRNIQMLARFFNEYLKKINDDMYLSRFEIYDKHIENLDESQFDRVYYPVQINELYLFENFLEKLRLYLKDEQTYSIKCALETNWKELQSRIINKFEITTEDSICMYYDKSLFSSAKEGFALGKEHFYIKNNSQSLISIPFIEIYQMSKNDNEIVIETIDNEIYFVNFEVNNQDIGEEIVKCIYEYIRGMQILEDKDEIKDEVKDETKTELKCKKCGQLLRKDAKFCTNCGTKVSEDSDVEDDNDYIYCPECGNKSLKRKKFCSNCGTKLI